MAAPTSLDDYREQENARRWGLVMIRRLGNACQKGSACGCFSALAELTEAEWRRAAADGARNACAVRCACYLSDQLCAMATIVQRPPTPSTAAMITVEVDGVPKPLLSRREIAERLGLSITTVAEHCRIGRIPSVKFGRRRLIPAAWLAELARQAMQAQRGTPGSC